MTQIWGHLGVPSGGGGLQCSPLKGHPGPDIGGKVGKDEGSGEAKRVLQKVADLGCDIGRIALEPLRYGGATQEPQTTRTGPLHWTLLLWQTQIGIAM